MLSTVPLMILPGRMSEYESVPARTAASFRLHTASPSIGRAPITRAATFLPTLYTCSP